VVEKLGCGFARLSRRCKLPGQAAGLLLHRLCGCLAIPSSESLTRRRMSHAGGVPEVEPVDVPPCVPGVMESRVRDVQGEAANAGLRQSA
jgi:hypothetical protein